MDVVLTAGEADDVTADAGAEVDDSTLVDIFEDKKMRHIGSYSM